MLLIALTDTATDIVATATDIHNVADCSYWYCSTDTYNVADCATYIDIAVTDIADIATTYIAVTYIALCKSKTTSNS